MKKSLLILALAPLAFCACSNLNGKGDSKKYDDVTVEKQMSDVEAEVFMSKVREASKNFSSASSELETIMNFGNRYQRVKSSGSVNVYSDNVIKAESKNKNEISGNREGVVMKNETTTKSIVKKYDTVALEYDVMDDNISYQVNLCKTQDDFLNMAVDAIVPLTVVSSVSVYEKSNGSYYVQQYSYNETFTDVHLDEDGLMTQYDLTVSKRVYNLDKDLRVTSISSEMRTVTNRDPLTEEWYDEYVDTVSVTSNMKVQYKDKGAASADDLAVLTPLTTSKSIYDGEVTCNVGKYDNGFTPLGAAEVDFETKLLSNRKVQIFGKVALPFSELINAFNIQFAISSINITVPTDEPKVDNFYLTTNNMSKVENDKVITNYSNDLDATTLYFDVVIDLDAGTITNNYVSL